MGLGTKYEHCKWDQDDSEVEINAWNNQYTNCIHLKAYTLLPPHIFDAQLPPAWNRVSQFMSLTQSAPNSVSGTNHNFTEQMHHIWS